MNQTVRDEKVKVKLKKERKQMKRRKERKKGAVSKNSYNSYPDRGIYSPHSGVPLLFQP